MCELLIDDFSLLKSKLKDASITQLGSEAGFNLGNAEAVHRVVDSMLKNDQIVHTDDWAGREITLPVWVEGDHRAALSDMAARLHLALHHPQKLTLVPCDGWGAPSWWRIQWATLDAVTDDFADAGNHYHAYNITLGVSAWARSTETYTSTGTNAAADDVLYDHSVDGSTGWAAINGTLDAGVDYVGVLSDGSSSTMDTLRQASLLWSPGTTYTHIVVEAKVNPGTSGGTGIDGGGVFPRVGVYSHGVGGTTFVAVATAVVSRTDLGSGWYREKLQLSYGLPALEGLQIVAQGGDPADQDLKVRKVSLTAGNTFPGGQGNLFVDVPGSAPTSGDLRVSSIGSGLLLYTAPNLPEIVDGTAEGTYHLIANMSRTADCDRIDWSVSLAGNVVQTGSVNVASLPYDGNNGWVCFANNVYLPPAPGGGFSVSVQGWNGAAPVTVTYLKLWMENPLTGYSASYTIAEPAPGANDFVFVAPTPARPVPSYLLSGVQDNSKLRAIGNHTLDPGMNRVFLAWVDMAAPPSVEVTWTGYPAWHTHAVPKSRWRPST